MGNDRIYHLQYTAAQIAAAVGKGPIIQTNEAGDKTWWLWDIADMTYKDTGVTAYLGDIDDATRAAARAEAAVTLAREYAEEAAASAADAREHGGGGGGGYTPHELEDYEAEVGSFVNTGAGWNTYRFRDAFDEIPNVVVSPVNFSGWVEIRNITREGFLYCLRKPVFTDGADGSVAEGSVGTGSYYTATGTASNSSHSAQTLVKSVTLPTITMPTLPTAALETTEEAVEIQYIAFDYGGDR